MLEADYSGGLGLNYYKEILKLLIKVRLSLLDFKKNWADSGGLAGGRLIFHQVTLVRLSPRRFGREDAEYAADFSEANSADSAWIRADSGGAVI